MSYGQSSEDNTAGVREREDANRTREAGGSDGMQSETALTLLFSTF